ncbi:fructose-1,6-bisphosphatase [Coprobacter tertius]|uniref:Fructose-1,6-bisphosphatase class 3 n=1 Tax=Coprobacter tertius TaxID=2944915 RepID=A0ABT1MFN3_9BACT|nr:fructose-1,6-bisphosphatase [Coprobacter tertius]MCP9611442.1 fructose-1,6-bisphosphatase [Coprobacter tertius]
MNQTYSISAESVLSDLRYLQLLSNNFPTIADASTEIINLEAILNLPKGTEHFLTDIHGEYEAFQHVLKNASGSVRRKVDEIFGQTLRENEKKELCTLIYYPEQKLELIKAEENDIDDWYRITLHQLIKVCQNVSSKYTRSKVRKALPPEFSYILQELLHETQSDPNKQVYVNVIISTIISIGRADHFIIAMCNLIQRLIIDKLHIVGDIYDRGPGAHIIMDTLYNYHNVDIQWGNHDILWMGAAAGNSCCIANVLRLSMRYANLATIEDGYGINLLPLATFAMEQYGDDPCKPFMPKTGPDSVHNQKTLRLIAQMHKAISIIQFKLESQLILNRPEFGMEKRLLLDKINYEKGVLVYEGKDYLLKDTSFPTIDPQNPFCLTEEEEELIRKLKNSFINSEKLRKHIRWIYAHGGMYLVMNSNLLYHASIPLNKDGSFKEVEIYGRKYSGKSLLDKVDQIIRNAYFGDPDSEEQQYALDYMWYLWCGENAPSFDKDKMATFERYFVDDKSLSKEKKGYYYELRNEENICDMILKEFELYDPHSHIINGHIPVKTIQGEKPVKAGGKLLVIDGGFSKAYQSETGIAGYTLIYHSRGLQLTQHEPFQSTQKAIEEGIDIISTSFVLEFNSQRKMVRDTDIGKTLVTQIADLKRLLYAYQNGYIKEKS